MLLGHSNAKFDLPHEVVGTHLEKLSSLPSLEMHSSDNIINYFATISSVVGVVKSLSYDADLSTSLLNTAVQKYLPGMKESRSLFTVQKLWVKPTLLDFNDCLNQKAEAHDLMKQTSIKQRLRTTPTQYSRLKLPQGHSLQTHNKKARTNRLQLQQDQTLLSALYLKETTASGSVGSLKRSVPLSEPK